MSLSADGNFMAVGGIADGNFTGATWVFQYNRSDYTQVDQKLVGKEYVGAPQQGKKGLLLRIHVLASYFHERIDTFQFLIIRAFTL